MESFLHYFFKTLAQLLPLFKIPIFKIKVEANASQNLYVQC